MAYTERERQRARAAYVHDNLPLEQIALQCKVSLPTLTRWKRAAKKAGDDWDKVRAAAFMAGSGVDAVQRAMLTEYVTMHKSLMDSVLTDASIDPSAKVKALGSLADSFNKMVAASRRVLPETSELAVALQTLELLGGYVQREFPEHAPAFVEILEPFGAVLAQTFSQPAGRVR